MSAFDALYRGLTGHRASGEQRSFRQQMADLERETGSKAAAARAAGVSYATWWRWGKADRPQRPRPESAEKVRMARRRSLAGDRMGRAGAATARSRPKGTGPTIRGWIRVSRDRRYRRAGVVIGKPEAREQVAVAADALWRGDDEAAEEAMQEALRIEFGQDDVEAETGSWIAWT